MDDLEPIIDQPRALEEEEPLSELLRIGKDEMNLAEFPMTSLSDRPAAGETSLKFEDRIYDDRKKKVVVRRRIIEGSKEYGLPTATDDVVILGLIQLTKLKNGFDACDVPFSRHELIDLLGWPDKGQSYDRVTQSLHRLAAVTYHFENSWWDNRRKVWTTKIFGILDVVELNDGRESKGQGDSCPSKIVWNPIILESFQAGYLRSLDFQLCMRFKHSISLRIYRFLGKRFHLKPEWTFDLKTFAYEHVGLGRSYEGGAQIVRKLTPAIRELEAVGFLTPIPESKRFQKKERDWSVLFVQQPSSRPAQVETAKAQKPSPLIAELVARGVTAKTAAELAANHPAETIAAQIEAFDWLTGKKDKRIAKSPPGYLVKSIQVDYAAPEGFVSRAERARTAEAARARDEAEADARRREVENKARLQAEQRAADDHWESLTAAERKRVEDEALAALDEEGRRAFEAVKDVPSLRRAFLTTLRRERLVTRLREGGPSRPRGRAPT